MNGAILSISPHPGLLETRHRALQAAGFQVFSVSSETEAMFEIQMGRCGVLVLCHRLHEDVRHCVAREFKKYCFDGVIVGIVEAEPASTPQHLDMWVKHSHNAGELVAALLKHPVARTYASPAAS
jgi:hypothetical protein